LDPRTVEIPTIPVTNELHGVVLNSIYGNSQSGLLVLRQLIALGEDSARAEHNGSAIERVIDRAVRTQHLAIMCIDIDVMRLEMLSALEYHVVCQVISAYFSACHVGAVNEQVCLGKSKSPVKTLILVLVAINMLSYIS
jgi:hypothetical protein